MKPRRSITKADLDEAKRAADAAPKGKRMFRRRDLQKLITAALAQDVKALRAARRKGSAQA